MLLGRSWLARSPLTQLLLNRARPLRTVTLPPVADQYTGELERLALMAGPMSGTPADTIAGTPPLSASDSDPTKASTLGIRYWTSDVLLLEDCWSSSTWTLSWRPQIPPKRLTESNAATTAW